MGANAQTSVPAFTAGQVLTAQEQTEINTGIPVFATTTTRDAAFGGAGEKTLAEGQFAYIEASNTAQYYDGAAWQNIGFALNLIKAQTIGSAVASVTVTDVFSATYDNYMITINGGVASAGCFLYLQLGATTTGYYEGRPGVTIPGGTFVGNVTSNGSQFIIGSGTTGNLKAMTQLHSPYLSKNTSHFTGLYGSSTGQADVSMGFLNDTTSYTAFTITASTGTLTGGTIRVYGYQNS